MENHKFGLNQNVSNILDDYIAKTKTKFAVLINGEWGCGKTFFIKSFTDQFEKKTNGSVNSEITNVTHDAAPFFCHISLFDITSKKEIDAAIMAKANPLLSNEKAKTLGRFGAWAIDKMPMAPSGIGAIFNNVGGVLAEFIKTFPKNLVIVLDDIERSKLHIQEILGYVSSLLEENKAKVILICNEKEIISNDNKEIYSKFKEKVVGITLTITPDPDTILEANIDAVSNGLLKQALLDNKTYILDIVSRFGFKNLRSLEVFIFEAELIVASLDDEVLKDNTTMQNFLQNLFILSYTTKNDEISPQEIPTCYIALFRSAARNVNGTQTTVEDSKEVIFYKKYNTYLNLSNDNCNTFWNIFFSSGIISDKLNLYYKDNLATTHEDIAAPLKLWGLHSLSSEDFEKYKKIMLNDIKNKVYTDVELVLHAFGLLLYMSKSMIYEQSKGDIIAMANEYIVENDKLQIPKHFDSDRFWLQSGYSQQYFSLGSEEFQQVQSVLHEELKKMSKAMRTSDSSKLLQLDTNYLLGKINLGEMPHDDFMLHHIDCCEFFSKIVTAEERNDIFNACTSRAKRFQGGIQSDDIIAWFNGLRECFEQMKRQGQLTPFDIFIWDDKFTMDSWVINEINK